MMRRLSACLLVAWALLVGGVYSLAQTTPVQIVILSEPNCSEAQQFLGRASGLDWKHQRAYRRLICGLVTDGVWSTFDVFYVYATTNTTTALLNLKSASFNGTANGSPTFTADVGYTGVAGSSTVYIDTGFNASTAGGRYSQNSAHASVWNNTNATAANSTLGMQDAGGTVTTGLFPKLTADNNTYFRINDTLSPAASAGVAGQSDVRGHYVSNRSGASAQQGYYNAANQGVVAVSSAALANLNTYLLARNTGGTAVGGAYQIMAASFGGSLTSGNVTAYCARLNAYLTTIAGVATAC